MRKIYFLLWFVFAIAVHISAQKKVYNKEVLKANDYLLVENYEKASLIYDTLVKTYADDPFIQLKAGECYLFSEGQIKHAIELLEKAAAYYKNKNRKSREAIEVRFYLGQAYHLDYQFKKALETYETLKDQIPPQRKEAIEKIDREINYTKNAIDLESKPVDFKITNLGPSVNSSYDEHSPVVNLNEDLLLFTSNRETEQSLKLASGLNDEDIYYSLWREGKWITSRAIDINTRGNNATIGISPDGKTMLIYQNDGAVGNIYTSKLVKDKWGELQKMPSPINTMANETHASFSMDGNTLFFTSDRHGGFGGKDIYKVSKLPNGEWGKVINLGAGVNTPYDEESPYLHPGNKTLYFSSEGHKSIGGFDIFKATMDSVGLWTHVTNIGFPINSPYDDLFYVPTADEQRAYYVSKRGEGYGGSDIYLIEFPVDHPNSLTVVGGFIFKQNGDPAEEAVITITNKTSGIKEGVFRPSVDGKCIFIIPADNEYVMQIKVEGFNSITQSFKIPAGNAFARKGHTFYLDPIVLEPVVD